MCHPTVQALELLKLWRRFCSNSLYCSGSACTHTLHGYQNSEAVFTSSIYGSSTNAWLCSWLTDTARQPLLRLSLQVSSKPSLALADHGPFSTFLSTRSQVPPLLPPPIMCLHGQRTEKTSCDRVLQPLQGRQAQPLPAEALSWSGSC